MRCRRYGWTFAVIKCRGDDSNMTNDQRRRLVQHRSCRSNGRYGLQPARTEVPSVPSSPCAKHGRRPGADRRLMTSKGLIRNFKSDVYWWEPDGRVVRLSRGDGIYSMACVHPSGSHAVFWGGAEGRPRLWIADGKGGLDAITSDQASARYPAYDLGGRFLVYCVSSHKSEFVEDLQRRSTTTMPTQGARMAIMLKAADGAWERRLTDGRHLDQRPALSPDGTMVVFVSNRGGTPGLWLVAADGRSKPAALLTQTPAYRPWWSVDGKQIFFIVFGKERHRVHVMPISGGRPVPLINDNKGDTHGPYADPSGRHLIVHSTRDSDDSSDTVWRLYELPLDGTRPRRLAPPKHPRGAHGTRARNGVMTFDVAYRRR